MSDNEDQERGHSQPPPPAQDQELNPRPPSPLMGGVSRELPADDKVQRLLEAIKDELIAELGFEPPEMTATHYRTQMHAGTTYFVRVRIGDGKHIHIRMFDELFRGTEISLNGIRHHDEGGVGAEEKLAFIPIALSSDPEAIMMTHMEEMMFLRTGSEAGVSMRSVMNSLIGVPIPIQTQRPKEDE